MPTQKHIPDNEWEIIYDQISNTHEYYGGLPDSYKSDIHLILTAVQAEPKMFSSVPADLRDNYYIAKMALILKPENYFYLKKSLRNNDRLMLDCIKENAKVIMFVETTLLTPKNIDLINSMGSEFQFYIKKRLANIT